MDIQFQPHTSNEWVGGAIQRAAIRSGNHSAKKTKIETKKHVGNTRYCYHHMLQLPSNFKYETIENK